MQVLIIPLWLKRKLDANKLPLTVVLDTERLSTILTREDLFFLMKANSGTDAELQIKTIVEDFRQDGWESYEDCYVEKLSSKFSGAEYGLLCGQFESADNLQRRHLVYGDVALLVENTARHALNYETVMIDKEVCAVVIKADERPDGSGSLEAFLEVLQGQMGAEKVYGLKCFDLFCKKV